MEIVFLRHIGKTIIKCVKAIVGKPFIDEKKVILMNTSEEHLKETIQKALEKIDWEEKEKVELKQIIFHNLRSSVGSSYLTATFLYENPRTVQTYDIQVVKNDGREYPDYFAYSQITNTKSGKQVSHTQNTTRVADKLLYIICTQLEKETGVTVTPDIKEIKRFIREFGQYHQCIQYSTSYLTKLASRIRIYEVNKKQREDFDIKSFINSLIKR